MNKNFNLQKYIKTAFYEDDRGYWNMQTRHWQKAYKANRDAGMEPQAAWEKVLKEYQKNPIIGPE